MSGYEYTQLTNAYICNGAMWVYPNAPVIPPNTIVPVFPVPEYVSIESHLSTVIKEKDAAIESLQRKLTEVLSNSTEEKVIPQSISIKSKPKAKNKKKKKKEVVVENAVAPEPFTIVDEWKSVTSGARLRKVDIEPLLLPEEPLKKTVKSEVKEKPVQKKIAPKKPVQKKKKKQSNDRELDRLMDKMIKENKKVVVRQPPKPVTPSAPPDVIESLQSKHVRTIRGIRETSTVYRDKNGNAVGLTKAEGMVFDAYEQIGPRAEIKTVMESTGSNLLCYCLPWIRQQTVVDDDGKNVTIRVYAIDLPETQTALGRYTRRLQQYNIQPDDPYEMNKCESIRNDMRLRRISIDDRKDAAPFFREISAVLLSTKNTIVILLRCEKSGYTAAVLTLCEDVEW
jgi:hypothetical protein